MLGHMFKLCGIASQLNYKERARIKEKQMKIIKFNKMQEMVDFEKMTLSPLIRGNICYLATSQERYPADWVNPITLEDQNGNTLAIFFREDASISRVVANFYGRRKNLYEILPAPVSNSED